MIESISDILIITDVDGTLLREKNGISRENLEAIKRFTDKGGRFTVSTGRAIDVAKPLLEKIPINAPSVHINGGYFYDWQNDEIIEPNYISKYARFAVKKIKENPIATKVKLADLRHNSDITRLDIVDENNKYYK